MKVLQKIALGLLLAWTGSSLPAAAQDDFDPMPPPEPYMRYKVKVGVNEPGIAYSSGAGTYTVGSSVWINTSSYSTSYTFSHWLKNGVVYSTESGFYYTVDAAVEFVAVYDFTPIVPSDPSGIYPRKLFLESSMADACSFNRTSGAKENEGSSVYLRVYPNTGFEFKGWYENGKLVSENISFYYLMGNADVTLTAMFEYNPATPDDPNMADDQGEVDNIYTLTYLVDGKAYKTVSLKSGATITAENTPMREGYTFSGWSEIPATMPAHNVTVTGTFAVNNYILTYMVDGKEYKTVSVNYGATITAENAPTKEGYTFSGWSEIPATMPAHNVTVTGTFAINSYTLTYMVDGKEYKTVSVNYGATITAETAPTKEGYTFSGWSEIPATMPAHNITITGTFAINSYTLTYMVDGAEYKTVSVGYGSSITAETAPTKEGYTFSGWSEIPETMPAHDVTVTGSFSINSYTLTYMVDGVEYKTASVKYGSAITAETAPTKEGYTFSGWSEIPATMPAHNVTVSGTFIVNKYKVTFVVDGQVYATTEIEYGADVNPIGEPTKEGYTFNGWQNIPADMPAHDITVTGSFTVNQYVVTFMYGDNVLTTIEVTYGEAIELPTSLNSDRYTLIEWLNVPETMPAYDIIIYADYVDGINTITADSKDARYIQMNGMYTNELKQGLNIIRMKDGTAKKVWVK